jgi:hypothetical protein
MKNLLFAYLLNLLCCALFAGSVSALPIASDEPSSELVVQYGIPAEFDVTMPLSLVALQRQSFAVLSSGPAEARSAATVPEPATLVLLGLGIAGIWGFVRRSRQRVSS